MKYRCIDVKILILCIGIYLPKRSYMKYNYMEEMREIYKITNTKLVLLYTFYVSSVQILKECVYESPYFLSSERGSNDSR